MEFPNNQHLARKVSIADLIAPESPIRSESPIYISVDTELGSKEADERRRRNAESSSRWRAGKKAREAQRKRQVEQLQAQAKQQQALIEQLQGQVEQQEEKIRALEDERDFYRETVRIRYALHEMPSINLIL